MQVENYRKIKVQLVWTFAIGHLERENDQSLNLVLGILQDRYVC